jgi:HD superfamily phosphohydrolase
VVFLSEKAIPGAEMYVLGCYHMYRTVYLHKVVRSAEMMFRQLFRQYRERMHEPAVSQLSPLMLRYFENGERIDDFLALDDPTAGAFIKRCALCEDDRLRLLGRGLLDRRLFKAIDLSHWEDGGVERQTALLGRLRAEAVKERLDPDLDVSLDTAEDTAYRPYNPRSGEPDSQIYVYVGGRLREISTVSPTIAALRAKTRLARIFFPASFREKALRVMRDFERDEVLGGANE